MIVLTVMIETHPEHTASFRETVIRHANTCLTNEEGCVAFTVHDHVSEPNRFLLYEAYRTEHDLKVVHANTAWMKEFRAATGEWIKNRQADLWVSDKP